MPATKKKAIVLGATGIMGQKYIQSLQAPLWSLIGKLPNFLARRARAILLRNGNLGWT